MHQKRKEEWKKVDREKLKKYMRCDYRSSALYVCGKKNEIEEVGKDKMDRYLSRYIIKNA